MISGLLAPGLAAVAVCGAAAYGSLAPNNELFGRVIGHGPRSTKHLYLTFDDGPNPSATERVLEVLETHHVPAAFFLLGKHVEAFPELARRVGLTDHEIGNHTHSHRKLHVRGPRFIERDLGRAHHAIAAATGRAPRVFRAPHGYRNPFVGGAARDLGYEVFGWTFGVRDSNRPGAEEIRRRVRERVRPGAIILLHDGDGYDPSGDRSQTADALPGIVRDARDLGYEFRPLGEIMERRGAERSRA